MTNDEAAQSLLDLLDQTLVRSETRFGLLADHEREALKCGIQALSQEEEPDVFTRVSKTITWLADRHLIGSDSVSDFRRVVEMARVEQKYSK